MSPQVFPAHAGMIRIAWKSPESGKGVPRACGDDPIAILSIVTTVNIIVKMVETRGKDKKKRKRK